MNKRTENQAETHESLVSNSVSASSHLQVEQLALKVSMVGALVMGIAGLVVAVMSNSQAILLDGLFSFVGFIAAAVALRVTRQVQRTPDHVRPFGYGADESIFTTFRALSLLGVVLFAVVNALRSIAGYFFGSPPTALNLGPVFVYIVLILVICLLLWAFHKRAWTKSGRRSEILKLEANAAAFDGAVTGAAGLGLLMIAAFDEGPIADIAPIGDSLIVLLLCSIAAFRYFSDFRAGLAELAGVAAPANTYDAVKRVIQEPISSWGAEIVNIAVLKTGRTHSVVVFVDPGKPICADAVDALSEKLRGALDGSFGAALVVTVITAKGVVKHC